MSHKIAKVNSKERKNKSVMGGFRAIEIGGEMGFMCGKVLADLGCEVIIVEPPGGDKARNIGPFWKDIPHPERSLYWFAFNASKRGITLNIETTDGRQLFRELIKRADFLIESFPPRYMENLGVGYNVLSQDNSRIVMTSIVPYGMSGPYKEYRTCDIVAQAMGGLIYVFGDADRPPVRISYPQAYSIAGLQAAAGSMIAHYYREASGEGQHVTVSLQEAVAWVQQDTHLFWNLTGKLPERCGPLRKRPQTGVKSPVVWQCKDGYITFYIIGGPAGESTLRGLVKWMEEEGLGNEQLRSKDWKQFDWVRATQSEIDSIAEQFQRFFLLHTKAELFEQVLRRRLMLYPVFTAADIADYSQLKERGFWQEVNHDDLGTCIVYPGPFLRISEAVCKIWHRAPLIGEHNIEIFSGELGLTSEDLVVLKRGNVI